MMKMIVIKKEVDCPFYHLQVIHTLKALSFIGQCDGELDMTCEFNQQCSGNNNKTKEEPCTVPGKMGLFWSVSLPRL